MKKKIKKDFFENPRNQIPCHSSFSGGDHFRFGIICCPIRGSFAVEDHLRRYTSIFCTNSKLHHFDFNEKLFMQLLQGWMRDSRDLSIAYFSENGKRQTSVSRGMALWSSFQFAADFENCKRLSKVLFHLLYSCPQAKSFCSDFKVFPPIGYWAE